MQPIFRFAPSPNGALHLGHALSALINFEAAKQMNGRFLIRVEDIDTVRCTQDKIDQMFEDLAWLGIQWEEPVVRQSERFAFYDHCLDQLKQQGLVYPSGASRKEIQTAIQSWEKQQNKLWPRDPDGAPRFPRSLLSEPEKDDLQHTQIAWRLNMEKALRSQQGPLDWRETGPKSGIHPSPERISLDVSDWGDVILARKDCPTSYHLSVVLDDAAQGITHIVRGLDLFAATGLHRLLQRVFGLPEPLYHHHRLLNDEHGDKLSKSRGDTSLKTLRQQGISPQDIRRLVQFSDKDLEAFTL